MKKLHFLMLVFLSCILFACSEDEALKSDNFQELKKQSAFLKQNEAAIIAKKFIESQRLLSVKTRASNLHLNMVYTDLDEDVKTRSQQQIPAYYVFNMPNGYVIVSAHKATLPILGFSTESQFNPKSIPVNMKDILLDFKHEINYAREQGIQTDKVTEEARAEFLTANHPQTRARSYAVAPLLGSIKWNQSPYYNAYCPSNTPVGCVATATSQIMRYWKYPSASTGYHTYNHRYYGKLSFNYNYRINWNAMPKGRLRGRNLEIAKLCYGVAVGINMNFSRSGSGAWQYDVPKLLAKHYKYPNTIRNIYRSKYSYQTWANIIRKELQAGRPVQYAGHGNGGGHSFVCDGYSSNGYFHFNWGWGGMSDGYFLLNALNPGSLGTGGGSGGFNANQHMIIGFAPPAGSHDNDDNDDGNTNDDDNGDNNDNDNGGDNNDDATPNYCQSKAQSSYYAYIRGIQIGRMVNYSYGSRTGYNDYSSTKKVYGRAGRYLYSRFIPGFSSYRYHMYWNAWIDFNNDGNFDVRTEQVVHFNKKSTGSGYIKIPAGTKRGSYRIRISTKYGSYPTPCETFKHGEVEDYTLIIQ